MDKLRKLIKRTAIALAIAAIVEQLRRPADERTWEGTVVGFVPYDFRMPTLERARSRWWNPDEPRLFVPQVFGVGAAVDRRRRRPRLRPSVTGARDPSGGTATPPLSENRVDLDARRLRRRPSTDLHGRRWPLSATVAAALTANRCSPAAPGRLRAAATEGHEVMRHRYDRM